MANEQNLKPFTSDQSREEAKKNGRKGGIASGEKRRADKKLKTLATLILNSTVNDQRNFEYLKKEIDNIEDEQITRGALILAKIFMKANSENATLADLMRALELLRDTSGQKPVEKQEITNIDNKGFLKVVVDGIDISEDEK
jgi:hypothetical protein